MAAVTGEAYGHVGRVPDPGRRSGRRPGPTGTRGDIIRAAQKLFAERGYYGASMRAIAQEARVDAALIHHFFSSKEGVFAAAIEDSFQLPELVDDVLKHDTDEIGERLVRGYLDLWDDPADRDPMLAVMRSAVSYDDAARLLNEFIGTRVAGRIIEAIDVPHPELRATLIGAQLVGLAMIRSIVKIEPLASADPEVIVRCLAPTINRYISDDLDPHAGPACHARQRSPVPS